MSTAELISEGRLGDRLWFYTNYHCNLRCSYCLTESAPGVPRRELDAERIRTMAAEGAELGFQSFGITGGEPFLRDDLVAIVAELAALRPTLILSNATIFNTRRLRELQALEGLPVSVQISLDRPDPDKNDQMRGPGNFRKVVEAIPRLIERGIGVRVATTLDDPDVADPQEMERLCELHRSLGVPDCDHVVRPVIRRGRAIGNEIGRDVVFEDFEPELTITADGAFATPFGPTIVGGRLDTDLLVTRTTSPLDVPASALMRAAGAASDGQDARIGIR